MTDAANTSGARFDPGAGFLLAGTWRVEPSLNLLSGPDDEQRVPDKFMQVLVYLAGHPGLVSRQELMDAVWPDAVVVDESLTRAVSELRKLLGDDPRDPRYIETIPKKGYRLLAEVTALEDVSEPPSEVAATPRVTHQRFHGLLAAVVVLVVATAAVWLTVRDGGPAQLLSLTSLPGMEMHPALSAAGSPSSGKVRRASGRACSSRWWRRPVGYGWPAAMIRPPRSATRPGPTTHATWPTAG